MNKFAEKLWIWSHLLKKSLKKFLCSVQLFHLARKYLWASTTYLEPCNLQKLSHEQFHEGFIYFCKHLNHMNAKHTKWSNTLKIVSVCLTMLWDWRLKGYFRTQWQLRTHFTRHPHSKYFNILHSVLISLLLT